MLFGFYLEVIMMTDKEYERWLERLKRDNRKRKERQEKEARRQAKIKMSHGLCCIALFSLITGRVL